MVINRQVSRPGPRDYPITGGGDKEVLELGGRVGDARRDPAGWMVGHGMRLFLSLIHRRLRVVVEGMRLGRRVRLRPLADDGGGLFAARSGRIAALMPAPHGWPGLLRELPGVRGRGRESVHLGTAGIGPAGQAEWRQEQSTK